MRLNGRWPPEQQSVVMTIDAAQIAEAAAQLRAGQLVAFPTETVYGLGADASNAEAVAAIFAAKGRPADHPLIVHLADASWLDRYAVDVSGNARKLAEAFWPGPLTLILKRAVCVPDTVTGGQDTVGLRVPGHPVAQALLAAVGRGVAAPSANRFGRISPTRAEHVREELGEAVAQVLDGGDCEVGIESTIVDLSRGYPVLLRPGHITVQQLSDVLGIAPLLPDGHAPRASGSLEAHYAPSTRLQLATAEELVAMAGVADVGIIARCRAPKGCAATWRQLPGDSAGFAHALYASLRDLDHLGLSKLLVETPPEQAAWAGVADRLRRAVVGSNGPEPG